MKEANEKRRGGAGARDRAVPDSGETVTFSTSRFGDLEMPASRIIEFPEGIVGFPQQRRYALVDNPSGGPFRWLQSLDEPGLAFVVVEPDVFFENYDVPVTRDELAPIRLENPKDAVILVVLVVPANNPRGITANLQGPIVLNEKTRLAKQFVLQVPGYETRHPVFGNEATPSEHGDSDRDPERVESLEGGK